MKSNKFGSYMYIFLGKFKILNYTTGSHFPNRARMWAQELSNYYWLLTIIVIIRIFINKYTVLVETRNIMKFERPNAGFILLGHVFSFMYIQFTSTILTFPSQFQLNGLLLSWVLTTTYNNYVGRESYFFTNKESIE